MSRSRLKTPIFGMTTAVTEKQDKRLANRRLRRIVKQSVNQEDVHLPKLRQVSNIWSFDKDGKRFYIKATEKNMRK